MNNNGKNNSEKIFCVEEEKQQIFLELTSSYDKTKEILKKEKPNKILYLYKIYIFVLAFIILTSFNYKINSDKIKVGFYCEKYKNGGVERVMSLLFNLLSEKNIFKLYLITNQKKSDDIYSIPNNIERIRLSEQYFNIYRAIRFEKLDILVYNFYDKRELKKLNLLNNCKILAYDHSSFFYGYI